MRRRWHREFIEHLSVEHSSQERYFSRRSQQLLDRHSHCPYCGNSIGEYTTACASCGSSFAPSNRATDT